MDHERSVPGQPPGEQGSLRRAVGAVGGGLGCLALILALAIVAFLALAYFFDNPAFWIAVIALAVALSARKTSTRGQ